MSGYDASPGCSTQASPYLPLRSPNIRLISFDDTKDSGEIKINLLEAPLRKDLNYHALSYVWGDGAADKTIWVNECRFQVSTHLHNFLELAQRDSVVWQNWNSLNSLQTDIDEDTSDTQEGKTMRWWIDAICLDQKNIDERNEQVPRMGKIYSLASQVWIWYGLPGHIFDAETGFEELKQAITAADNVEESDSEKTYFSELARVERDTLSNGAKPGEVTHSQQRTEDVYKPILQPRRASTPDSKIVMDPTQVAIADASGQTEIGAAPMGEELRPTADFILKLVDQLASLAKHPYFFRTWIIQEFVLSQKIPISLIGSYSFHQQNVAVLAGYMYILHDIFTEQIWVRFSASMYAMHQIARLEVASLWYKALYKEPLSVVRPSPAARLRHFLLTFPDREYTVAQDIFYSLLGLLGVEELPVSLVPDYRLSFDQVSWHYTSYILQDTKDLRILGGENYELKDCPTWVPDMRYSNMCMDTYYSKPRTQGAVSVSADGHELIVEGARVGAVLKCSCQDSSRDAGEVNLIYLRNVLLLEASQIKSQSTKDTFSEWLSSYYKIGILYGSSFVGRYASMDDFVADFLTLRSFVARDVLDCSPLLDPDMLITLSRTSCPNPEILFAILKLAEAKWCLLDTGDIVICQRKPSDSAHHIPGDSVWALQNSHSMSLLRPQDNVWEYMGLIHQWQPPTDSDLSEEMPRRDSAIDLDEEYFATRDVQTITLV
jgi:hypothetical protein